MSQTTNILKSGRWGGVLLILVCLAVLIVWGLSPRRRVPRVTGKVAPNFEMTLVSGEKKSLSDFRGKAVLLNFWASWCVPCMEEMPSLRQLEDRFADKLVLLALNVEHEDPEVLEEFSADRIPRGLVYKFEDRVLDDYSVSAIPVTYLIDAQGKVVHRFGGPRDWVNPYTLRKIQKSLN